MSDQPKRVGRPPLPPEQRKGSTPTRTVRLNDERWRKLQRLGREWLERKLDEEPEPTEPAA